MTIKKNTDFFCKWHVQNNTVFKRNSHLLIFLIIFDNIKANFSKFDFSFCENIILMCDAKDYQ